MNIEIIMIILLAVVIVEALIIIVSLLAFDNELKYAVAYMKNYSEFVQNSLQSMQERSQKQMDEVGENIQKELIHYRNKTDEQNEMYKQFRTLIEAMVGRMKTIEENYKKLLDCWKGIDERYDQTYEQFKLLSEELKNLTPQPDKSELLEIAKSVCKLCPKEKCIHNNCPLHVFLDDADISECVYDEANIGKAKDESVKE